MAEDGFFKKMFRGRHDDAPSPEPPSGPPEPETTSNVSDTPTMSESSTAAVTDSVSRVYAQALLELAEEAGQIDAIAQEVNDLAALLAGNDDLQRLFDSRAIGTEARGQMIERVFQGKVSPTLYQFLRVVNAKDRLDALPAIFIAFGEKLDEKRGIVKVDAHVAAALDAGQADRVAAAVGESLGGKKVLLNQHIDPKLIGGLKLRIGDEMIDASVATQLKLVQRRLIATGHEKARKMVGAEGSSGQGAE